jgi:hypothetical protein
MMMPDVAKTKLHLSAGRRGAVKQPCRCLDGNMEEQKQQWWKSAHGCS